LDDEITIRRRADGTVLFQQTVGVPGISLQRKLGLALASGVALGVDFNGADLAEIDANGLDLRGARLENAYLCRSMLDGADLSRSNLSSGALRQVSARVTNFQQATLENSDLWASDLHGASFVGASAQDADFEDASASTIDLRGADLRGAILRRSDLSDAKAQGALFEGALASEVDLRGADMRRTLWDRADLTEALVDGIRFDGASFVETEFKGMGLAGRAISVAGDEVIGWRTRGGDIILANGVTMSVAEYEAELRNSSAGGRQWARYELLVDGFRRLDRSRQPGTTVDFHWRRSWLMMAAPSGAATAFLTGWVAWHIADGWFDSSSVFSRVTMSSAFGFFALFMGVAAVSFVLAIWKPSPVVTMDKTGLFDRRLTRAPIPWADIRSVGPVQYNGELMLTVNVDKTSLYRLSTNPMWAVNRLCARFLRRPELGIKMKGLSCDLQAVLDAVQAVAPDRHPS
jgi:uncharacterized protein YjbI with pentapeptide repeats